MASSEYDLPPSSWQFHLRSHAPDMARGVHLFNVASSPHVPREGRDENYEQVKDR